jgi:hypothetical protein
MWMNEAFPEWMDEVRDGLERGGGDWDSSRLQFRGLRLGIDDRWPWWDPRGWIVRKGDY